MKLASYLKQSRHGIFYYRIQFQDTASKWREINASLGTRDPIEAKAMAYALTAKIQPFLTHSKGKAMSFDPNDLNPASIREMVLRGVKIGNMTIEHVETSNDPTVAKQELDALASLASKFDVPDEREQAIRALVDQEKSELESLLQEQKKTLTEAIDSYFKFQVASLSESSKITYRSRLEMLSKHIGGGRQVNSIKSVDVVRALECVKTTAPNDSKRNVKIEGQLGVTTVKDIITLWRSFFDYLISSGYYQHDNPTRTLKAPARPKTEEDNGAKSFTKAELGKIFNPESFSKFKTPHEFFVPFLALFTGARANELACLPVANIGIEGNINFIEFKHDVASNVLLKNAASNRRIAIHPKLIELGFLDYIAEVKALGFDRIFPYLPLDAKKKRERYVSRDVNDYLKKIGVWKTREKVLHSFRDTLISSMADKRAHFEYRHDYTGHSRANCTTQSEKYVRKATLEDFANYILPCIDFEFIIVDGFKYQRNRFDDYNSKNSCP
jgi:integrase